MHREEVVTSLSDILEKIESISGRLREHGVTELVIFGSVARGEANDRSDLDAFERILREA